MLVLSRNVGQVIMVGDEIEIEVCSVKGDKVRLGITAPTRIAVHRKEIYEAVRAEGMTHLRGRDGSVVALPTAPTPSSEPVRPAVPAAQPPVERAATLDSARRGWL